MKNKTIPRNTISKEYELNPKNVRRRELTVRWLNKFNIENKCLDCGDRSLLTDMIEKEHNVKIQNTTHNLDWKTTDNHTNYANIFIFEVIEHLLNPLLFLDWIKSCLQEDGNVFISTPLNRINILRNKKTHFHEFHFNELEYLVKQSGFVIIDKTIINTTKFRYIFTGFKPFLRWLGFDRHILLCLNKAS